MGVWSKLITAIKGGVNEAVEAVADSQAMRILDQEIREAKQELRRSDEALVQVMAKRKLAEQQVASLKASIAEYEQHAIAANNKGDQQLALDCARRVSELRSQEENEQQYLQQFIGSEKTLRQNISQAKSNIRRIDQQIDMIKATESVQKAQAAVSSSHIGANSKMKTAAESLKAIQTRQKERQAQLESAAELASEEAGDGLETRLRQAGIASQGGQSASDELARILEKQV